MPYILPFFHLSIQKIDLKLLCIAVQITLHNWIGRNSLDQNMCTCHKHYLNTYHGTEKPKMTKYLCDKIQEFCMVL